jgi:hypothetical protein
MVTHKLLIFYIVLALAVGAASTACSENSPAGQERAKVTLPPDWQEKQKLGIKDHYQFVSPVKPTKENKYLILDPDGQTPSDYQKFLSPLDQYDKNAKD